MPTGYTAKLYDGEDQSFKEFAMHCARAFGALITMRDEPETTPIPDTLKPTTYYRDNLQDALLKLDQLQHTDISVCAALAKKEYDADIKAQHERDVSNAALKRRYTSMLDKVHAWDIPSKSHTHLKEFMIEQLTNSIGFDIHDNPSKIPYTPVMLTGEEWLIRKISLYTEDIAYYTEKAETEEQKFADDNLWVNQLRDSL